MYTQGELSQLDSRLQDGNLLLVPNFRSSRQLQDLLADFRRQQGQQSELPEGVLQSSAIIAVDLWLSDLWQQLAMHSVDAELARTPLTSSQEMLLWQEVIRSSPAGALILNTAGTAETARQAWQLQQQWLLPALPQPAEAPLNLNRPAWEIYADWAGSFRALCEEKAVISFSSMLAVIVSKLQSDPELLKPFLPPGILLHHFDSPPPLYRQLFAALRDCGLDVSPFTTAACKPNSEIRSCHQQMDEVLAAAQWAKAVHMDRPDASIAIVCSDPAALSVYLERIFRRTFSDSRPDVYLNCSQPMLSESAFVQTALALLEMHEDYCDSSLLCQLLRSRWLAGSNEELDGRAALEIQLRRQGEIRTRMSDFRWRCLESGYRDQQGMSPLLGKALLDFREQLLRQPERQGLADWLTLFIRLWQQTLDIPAMLNAGLRTELRSWQDFIEQLQGNAYLSGDCSLRAAVQLVRSTAGKQQMTPHLQTAPVMLLSPTACTGMRFTHMWCLQMNEQNWPADSYPNPLLPFSQLQEYGLPDTSAELRSSQARLQIQALLDSCREQLVFSYARSEADTDLKASRLLPAVPITHLPAPPQPAVLQPLISQLQNDALLTAEDVLHLPTADQPLSGGSALLADQAACPFRAFAIHRLHAAELREFQYGLPASAVGSCIHAVLESLWDSLLSKAALLSSAQSQIRETVSAAVSSALQKSARLYPYTMTPAFLELEKSRLTELTLCWLEQEKLRGEFSRIAAEQQLQWHYRNLTLNLRLDRIDRDSSGNSVIIDYKSGKPPAVDWQAERQDLPQLMLYLQAIEQQGEYPPVSALLYACVNIENPVYRGLGVSDEIYPGISFENSNRISSPDWQTLKQFWQQNLQTLAQEFLDGYCAVQPLKNSSCNYCHLSALCRIGDDAGNTVYTDLQPGSALSDSGDSA